MSFDAVTAELQINEQAEAPLLCVTGVHDIASGDLSLPGQVNASHQLCKVATVVAIRRLG